MTNKHPSQKKGSREEPIVVLPALPLKAGDEVDYHPFHVGPYRAVVVQAWADGRRVDIDVDPRVPSPGGPIPEPLRLTAVRIALESAERGCVTMKGCNVQV